MQNNRQKTRIQFWRKDTIHDGQKTGWFCWVYPADDVVFSKWMKQYCPSAEFEFRFNSGDPMFTVFIRDEKEALLFKLLWDE